MVGFHDEQLKLGKLISKERLSLVPHATLSIEVKKALIRAQNKSRGSMPHTLPLLANYMLSLVHIRSEVASSRRVWYLLSNIL